MSRSAFAMLALVAALTLTSCGDGGEICERTADDVKFAYSPGTETALGTALVYRRGETTTWKLSVRGVTRACLRGLRVELADGTSSLPVGMALNPATGEISSSLTVSHVEGYCSATTSYDARNRSVDRSCPAGQTFHEARYRVLVMSERVNQTTKLPTTLTFVPEK